jgi:hypothetical protein
MKKAVIKISDLQKAPMLASKHADDYKETSDFTAKVAGLSQRKH